MDKQCEKCSYWHTTSQPAGGLHCRIGQCRRFHPMIVGEREFRSAEFPETSHEDWCGEFKQSFQSEI